MTLTSITFCRYITPIWAFDDSVDDKHVHRTRVHRGTRFSCVWNEYSATMQPYVSKRWRVKWYSRPRLEPGTFRFTGRRRTAFARWQASLLLVAKRFYADRRVFYFQWLFSRDNLTFWQRLDAGQRVTSGCRHSCRFSWLLLKLAFLNAAIVAR